MLIDGQTRTFHRLVEFELNDFSGIKRYVLFSLTFAPHG
jgi:hypothetical protein